MAEKSEAKTMGSVRTSESYVLSEALQAVLLKATSASFTPSDAMKVQLSNYVRSGS